MTSFASIDRIEGKNAVVEVELLPFEESRSSDFADKDTVMMNITLQQIPNDFGEVNEGDILVVEHDGENVSMVYYKDEEERTRRIELLRRMWS